MTTCARKKVLLMILDGWGIGRGDRADVIGSVRPQRLGEFAAKYPHAELRTDGENVGLPDGQMGNSEVGHLNIGAGYHKAKAEDSEGEIEQKIGEVFTGLTHAF